MNKNIKVLLVLLTIIAVYCSSIYFAKDIAIWLYDLAPSTNANDVLARTGQFGDSAGMINALFSALAFFAVLWTLIIQKDDSKEQRKKEKKEMFESTFFQMMSLQQEIVKDLSIRYTTRRITIIHTDQGGVEDQTREVEITTDGRDTFQYAYLELKLPNDNTTYTGMKHILNDKGKEIYEYIPLPTHFDHYFRHLYSVVKFIDKTDLLSDDFEMKYQYASMVRAQLSRFELIWIFYNCLSPVGFKKFKPLIERYALLKNIRPEFLADESDINLYRDKMRKDYQERVDADFAKEYRHSAFVKTDQSKKIIKFTIPKVLDININIKYSKSILK